MFKNSKHSLCDRDLLVFFIIVVIIIRRRRSRRRRSSIRIRSKVHLRFQKKSV